MSLQIDLGPHLFHHIACDQALLWAMTIFYVIVFVTGILGNMSVIVVIIKSKGLHCAMNYYLVSLALADILIIILGNLGWTTARLDCWLDIVSKHD